jgi:hypothetical protein
LRLGASYYLVGLGKERHVRLRLDLQPMCITVYTEGKAGQRLPTNEDEFDEAQCVPESRYGRYGFSLHG